MLLILFIFPCSYLRQWAICCDDIYALSVILKTYPFLSFCHSYLRQWAIYCDDIDALSVILSLLFEAMGYICFRFCCLSEHLPFANDVSVSVVSVSVPFASPARCILLLWIRQETINHQGCITNKELETVKNPTEAKLHDTD